MRGLLAFATAVLLASLLPLAASAEDQGLPPVSTPRALALFDAICGETAKGDFASARSRMKKNGVSTPSPLGTPTIYSGKEDLSFQIMDGPGFGKTCSMVYGSKEKKSGVMALLKKQFAFRETALGTTGMDRKHQRLVLFQIGGKAEGKTYYNLRLLSDH